MDGTAEPARSGMMTGMKRSFSGLVAAAVILAISAACAAPPGDSAAVPDSSTADGSAPVSSATATEVPGSAGPVTGPGSSGPITSATPTAVDPVPPTDGPGPDAVPILWITDGPGYYCATAGTLVPDLVVYSDYSAIRTGEGIGAYCESVPTLTRGFIDPALIRSVMQEFQDEDLAGVDLGLDNLMDAGTTYLSVRGVDTGAVQVAAAYGLGYEGDTPADQRGVRGVMTGIRTDLEGAFVATGKAPVERLVVTAGLDPMTQVPTDAPPTWPSEAPGGDCAEVDPADVPEVLAANGDRLAGSQWQVDSVTVGLAVGVVLPGFAPCADVIDPTADR